MWRQCPAFFPYFIDTFLRISKQPFAGKMALGQREDMLLFNSRPKTSCAIQYRSHAACSLGFLDVCVFRVDDTMGTCGNPWLHIMALTCFLEPDGPANDEQHCKRVT
jgi:hypothetical protein